MLALMGCTGFQVQGDIQAGREALMMGRSWWALNRFQRAAQLDPHYVTDFTVFEEGVWTYIGRALYQLGELEQARKALKRAREEHNGDHLAHIYLGLVLIRQGESERGVREAAVGLRSLQAWLKDLDRYDSAGQYWDPGSVLENEIEYLLAIIGGGDVRWLHVALRLERLGMEFEEEIDRAWEDELNDQDSGDDSPT